MAKYCMRCGEKNEDGVSACKGCGMPLEETPSHNEKVAVKLVSIEPVIERKNSRGRNMSKGFYVLVK